MSRHACLDVSFITPTMRQLFQVRRQSPSKAVEEWEKDAVEWVMSTQDREEFIQHTRFMAVAFEETEAVVPEVLDPKDVLFQLRALWPVFTRKRDANSILEQLMVSRRESCKTPLGKRKRVERPVQRVTKKAKAKRANPAHDHAAIAVVVQSGAGVKASTFTAVMTLLLASEHAPAEPSSQAKPSVAPPVWAESRQELCETLPYFRAYQSGLYMHDSVAYGYLLDGFASARDLWTDRGRVIVSHGGGKAARVMVQASDGKRSFIPVLKEDQTMADARISTLVKAAELRTPIVLIAGRGYALLPWDLGVGYVVLGWYWVSSYWVEAESPPPTWPVPAERTYFHRRKFRFDWIQNQGEPWWHQTTGVPWLPEPKAAGVPHRQEANPVAMPLELKPTRTPDESSDYQPLPVNTLPESNVEPPSGESHDPILATLPTYLYYRHEPGTQLLGAGDSVLLSNAPLKTTLPSDRTCPGCGSQYDRIYQEGVICMQTSCSFFWALETPLGLLPIPPGFPLSYEDDFQRVVSTPADMGIPFNVRIPPPVSSEEVERAGIHPGATNSRSFWKGWLCNCGRANSRARWSHWNCANCGQCFAPLNSTVVAPVRDLQVAVDPPFLGDADLVSDAGITTTYGTLGRGWVAIYHLPEDAGIVYHIHPNDEDAADRLFEDYQVAAASSSTLFTRRNLKVNPIRGALLSQQYMANAGAHYKFIAEAQSTSLKESPECIQLARDTVQSCAKSLGLDANFNEVLSVLYRDGQKMAWHDDGEKGLGPIVGSLSLGSAAIMSFRRKGTRSVLNMPYLKATQIPLRGQRHGATLSLTLAHGDVLIMAGETLQHKYDHRVTPLGFRVAATVRRID